MGADVVVARLLVSSNNNKNPANGESETDRQTDSESRPPYWRTMYQQPRANIDTIYLGQNWIGKWNDKYWLDSLYLCLSSHPTHHHFTICCSVTNWLCTCACTHVTVIVIVVAVVPVALQFVRSSLIHWNKQQRLLHLGLWRGQDLGYPSEGHNWRSIILSLFTISVVIAGIATAIYILGWVDGGGGDVWLFNN